MASQPAKTKVIVVGAGIAGPVLATFLKLNGYDPVVYEQTSGVGDKGLGHGIASLPFSFTHTHSHSTPLAYPQKA